MNAILTHAFSSTKGKLHLACSRETILADLSPLIDSVRYYHLATLEGEALGLFRALNWLKDLGHQQVMFEVVSKVVADQINKPMNKAFAFGSIIKSFLKNFISFSHLV